MRVGLRHAGVNPLAAFESSTDYLTIVGCYHDCVGFLLVHHGAIGSVAVDRTAALAVLPSTSKTLRDFQGRRGCWPSSATSWQASWERGGQIADFDGGPDVLADLSSLHRHGIQFRALGVLGLHYSSGYSGMHDCHYAVRPQACALNGSGTVQHECM